MLGFKRRNKASHLSFIRNKHCIRLQKVQLIEMNKHYIHFYSSKCSETFGNGQEIVISPKPFEARALEAR